MEDERKQFDWSLLVPNLIHPLRVAIIEALAYVDVPLSATDLRKLFGGDTTQLSLISYHMRELRKAGALTHAGERQVRGSLEKFYVLRQA